MLQRLVDLLRPTALEDRGPGEGFALSVHVALASGRVHLDARVLPGVDLVLLLLRVPAREQSVEILRVAEVLTDDRGGVGVAHDVLAELSTVLDDVVDDPAQEGDVRAGPDRD